MAAVFIAETSISLNTANYSGGGIALSAVTNAMFCNLTVSNHNYLHELL